MHRPHHPEGIERDGEHQLAAHRLAQHRETAGRDGHDDQERVGPDVGNFGEEERTLLRPFFVGRLAHLRSELSKSQSGA